MMLFIWRSISNVCFPTAQMSLRDNDLISLPKEIGDLAQLKELHIQGNRLTVLPPELGTDHTYAMLQLSYLINLRIIKD